MPSPDRDRNGAQGLMLAPAAPGGRPAQEGPVRKASTQSCTATLELHLTACVDAFRVGAAPAKNAAGYPDAAQVRSLNDLPGHRWQAAGRASWRASGRWRSGWPWWLVGRRLGRRALLARQAGTQVAARVRAGQGDVDACLAEPLGGRSRRAGEKGVDAIVHRDAGATPDRVRRCVSSRRRTHRGVATETRGSTGRHTLAAIACGVQIRIWPNSAKFACSVASAPMGSARPPLPPDVWTAFLARAGWSAVLRSCRPPPAGERQRGHPRCW
jgi:hypothetical protein